MSFDVFAGLNALGGGFIGYLVPFLLVLTVVVFFHELGHFLVARWTKVRVMTFSIGFGPELFGFNDRHGTRWKLSAVPLGGYVKFFGDDNAASVPDQTALASMTAAERSDSFVFKPVWARAAIVAAGPIANFILAIVIFAGVFSLYGKPVSQEMSARVDGVQAGSAAEKAGFQVGDLVVAIDGKPVENFEQMKRVVSARAGESLTIDVDRGNQRLNLKAVPELRTEKDTFGNVRRLGVLGISRVPGAIDRQVEKAGPIMAIGLGVQETWFVVSTTFSYIGGIFAGREAADQLGGPIMIAQASGQVASLGVAAFVHFIGLLSVSIGLLNLFPVPLLDGGHLLFYAIEVVRGRPLSERVQEYGFRVGFALVLALMIFAAKNDIWRLWNLATS